MQITVEVKDNILQLQINRPEKKNALTLSMYQDMTAALRQAAADPVIRVIMIHGLRDVFSAGNDLQDFMKGIDASNEQPVLQFLHELNTMPKPVIAAVSGSAIGIGTTMLLHCDLVYAAEKTRFQLPFVNLALVPEAGSSLLLPALVGYQKAAELLFLGEIFSAEEALKYGLVNQIVKEDDLLTTALTIAKKLAVKPPSALRATKQLMKQFSINTVAKRINEEAVHFVTQLKSAEAKEAFNAFYEKRAPDFSKFN